MAMRGYKLQELIAHASGVKCLNIGKKTCHIFVTGGEDKKVNLWAIGKPNSFLSLSGHTSSIESVTLDLSESLVLAGSSTGIVKLWDMEDPKAVRTLSGHTSKCSSLEFHPFGEFFASGSSDANIKIWDIRKKGCIHTYKGHTRGITTIRFTPDGRWLVSGGEDNVVKLWDLTAGKLLHDFKCHNGAVSSIDFHPHEFLLATGSTDRTVKFWDLETFELIGSAGPETTGVRSMIFHPDGKTLFCGLEQKLKVFSWEPIRCHDDVDIGWSSLGDLSLYEGRLLGCSYNNSCVRVWVVDLSLIGPYAVGAFSRPIPAVEPGPELKNVVDHALGSFSAYTDASNDNKFDTKEIIHTECCTYKSDEVNKKSFGRTGVEDSKASKTGLALFKDDKDIDTLGSQSFNAGSKSTSFTSSLNLSKKAVPTEMKAASKTSGSNVLRKSGSTKSSRLRGSSLLNSKKDYAMDLDRWNNTQVNKTICMPVVIMRDNADIMKSESGVMRAEAHDFRSCVPSHSQQSLLDDVGNESHLGMSKIATLGRSFDAVSTVAHHKGQPRSGGGGRTVCEMNSNDVIKTTAEAFQRVFFLDPSFDSKIEKDQELPDDSFQANTNSNKHEDLNSSCCTTEADTIKFAKGVAVQHGRTRSLVESWEKRERVYNGCTLEPSVNIMPQIYKSTMPHNEQVQGSGTDFMSEGDNDVHYLLQGRDQLMNILKSRLTKIQMVKHCWEQNGIKGAINSVAKLPDLSVHVDVISILIEKTDLLTLDFFSSLLPILVGLLGSKTDRHVDVSLDMLLKLVKLFWPVVQSTTSAGLPVGVDIEAEERVKRCRQIFIQFKKIKEILPSLLRKGGLTGRRSVELNLALQC